MANTINGDTNQTMRENPNSGQTVQDMSQNIQPSSRQNANTIGNTPIPYLHNTEKFDELYKDDMDRDYSKYLLDNQNRTRQDIKDLQAYLRLLSAEYPEIPRIAVDGYFGVQTVEALRAFQRLAGLEPTGTIDYDTWNALYDSYNETVKKNKPPRKLQVFPNKDHVIREGEISLLVSQLQLILAFLSQIFINFINQEITGQYDEPTMLNIREFQRAAGLPQTGLVDKATWDALALAYNHLVSMQQRKDAETKNAFNGSKTNRNIPV